MPSGLELYERDIHRCSEESHSRELELGLIELAQNGDDTAKSRLVIAHLLKVKKLAEGVYSGFGLPISDLIAAGNEGLEFAIMKFNREKSRNARFWTFAQRPVSQHMIEAIGEHANDIKIPPGMLGQIIKMIRKRKELMQVYGREPTDEELANELEITVEHLRKIQQRAKAPISIFSPLSDVTGDGEPSILLDTLENPNARLPDEEGLTKDLIHRVRDIVMSEILTYNEREVITRLFGFDGGGVRNGEEVGREMRMTRANVSLIKLRAFRKIEAALGSLEDPEQIARDNFLQNRAKAAQNSGKSNQELLAQRRGYVGAMK